MALSKKPKVNKMSNSRRRQLEQIARTPKVVKEK